MCVCFSVVLVINALDIEFVFGLMKDSNVILTISCI